MYFSKLELLPKALAKPAVFRAAGDPAAFHRLVWRMFSDSPQRQRDFLYRLEGRMAYAVSAREPLDRDGIWRVQPKPYTPSLKRGQRLRFSLRANPIVSRRDDKGRQHRYDVVMDYKKRELQDKEIPRHEWPSQAAMAQKAATAWLQKRAGSNGFGVEPGQVLVQGYHQIRFSKKGHKVSLASLELCGQLTVLEPEAFRKALYGGIGPAKGYGFGLLLVRPA